MARYAILDLKEVSPCPSPNTRYTSKTVEMGSFYRCRPRPEFHPVRRQPRHRLAGGGAGRHAAGSQPRRCHPPRRMAAPLAPYFQEMCALSHRLEQHAEDRGGWIPVLSAWQPSPVCRKSGCPVCSRHFREKYPRIEFELLPSNFNNEISDWVLHGQADCGFISLPTPAEKYPITGCSSGTSGRSSCPATTRWRAASPSHRRPWSSTPHPAG